MALQLFSLPGRTFLQLNFEHHVLRNMQGKIITNTIEEKAQRGVNAEGLKLNISLMERFKDLIYSGIRDLTLRLIHVLPNVIEMKVVYLIELRLDPENPT
jgi:hypothetical protein